MGRLRHQPPRAGDRDGEPEGQQRHREDLDQPFRQREVERVGVARGIGADARFVRQAEIEEDAGLGHHPEQHDRPARDDAESAPDDQPRREGEGRLHQEYEVEQDQALAQDRRRRRPALHEGIARHDQQRQHGAVEGRPEIFEPGRIGPTPGEIELDDADDREDQRLAQHEGEGAALVVRGEGDPQRGGQDDGRPHQRRQHQAGPLLGAERPGEARVLGRGRPRPPRQPAQRVEDAPVRAEPCPAPLRPCGKDPRHPLTLQRSALAREAG